MAEFEAYNAAGTGFNMPASAANGWITTSTGGGVYDVWYDDGSIAQFDVYYEPRFDFVEVRYNISGDTVTIYDITYSRDGWVVLEMLGLNVQGSVDDIQNASFLNVEVNSSNDIFGGNDYIDIIYAGPGNDDVYGYGGNDFLSGDGGDDYLDGMLGNDVLSGGTGFDFLGDKPGKDKMFGGPDGDTFYFGKGYKKDTIKDIEVFQDVVMIERSVAKNFGDLLDAADKYKGGVALEFSKNDVLKIDDIKIKHLDAIDFDFV